MDVKGRYIEHESRYGFIYEYTCPCGRIFKSVAPELSSPTLCHRCYTGNAVVVNANSRAKFRARAAKKSLP